ncbi:hypothetical protein PVAP13_4NG169400 [Panicum virgatum]|uniref:Uncharacterized protein n=1 Tax=Panicum virgatum TaxID=38727 RepID=A0A8T0TB62_PANVG|nr:hypothetical protein PVAP13_4NG169400 [Panicum virgatum]
MVVVRCRSRTHRPRRHIDNQRLYLPLIFLHRATSKSTAAALPSSSLLPTEQSSKQCKLLSFFFRLDLSLCSSTKATKNTSSLASLSPFYSSMVSTEQAKYQLPVFSTEAASRSPSAVRVSLQEPAPAPSGKVLSPGAASTTPSSLLPLHRAAADHEPDEQEHADSADPEELLPWTPTTCSTRMPTPPTPSHRRPRRAEPRAQAPPYRHAGHAYTVNPRRREFTNNDEKKPGVRCRELGSLYHKQKPGVRTASMRTNTASRKSKCVPRFELPIC